MSASRRLRVEVQGAMGWPAGQPHLGPRGGALNAHEKKNPPGKGGFIHIHCRIEYHDKPWSCLSGVLMLSSDFVLLWLFFGFLYGM